jgi:DNA-directed RNA polymerase subunit RPC12/RpoP
MRRSRSYDPTKFDLSTPCPECGYRIPPSELMRLDNERMRCPECQHDVPIPAKGNNGTAVPIKREG